MAVLLVNVETGSATDLFVCYLRSVGRVIVMGSTTHGNLSGTGVYVALPCHLVVRISNGFVCDATGQPIEVNGNRPDVPVEPAVTDLIKGRDLVLEKAVAVLSGKSKVRRAAGSRQ